MKFLQKLIDNDDIHTILFFMLGSVFGCFFGLYIAIQSFESLFEGLHKSQFYVCAHPGKE